MSRQWITENPWQTEQHLEPDETETISYHILTPDKTGTYRLQTEIEYLEGRNYKAYQSLSTEIEIDRDTASVTREIITELNRLTVTEKDRERLDRAIRYIEDVQEREINREQDIDKNIQDLLKAVDSLLSITSADTSAVRLMIDELLRIWESRFYFYEA